MFKFALVLGLYSYLIFTLGVLGLLYKPVLLISMIIFLTCIVLLVLRSIGNIHFKVIKVKNNKTNIFFTVLVFSLMFVNLIGALGPELAFDALWYHLTLPKIYLEHHKIFYLPGSLFYYSVMPKLGEMVYTPLLLFSEITAKLFHYFIGILVTITIFNFLKKTFSSKIAIICAIAFYSNLVVDWESITAYTDLFWAFYNLLAFIAFLKWKSKKEHKYILLSAVFTGFAITCKIIALEVLPIYIILLFIDQKRINFNVIKLCMEYVLVSFIIPFPWLLFSYFNTKNLFYPFFTNLYHVSYTNFNIHSLFNNFLYASDPISPIYLILIPLILISFKKLREEYKMITIYFFLSLAIWELTPQSGGARFLVPYLPVYSILIGELLRIFKQSTYNKVIIGSIVVIAVLSITYRLGANLKYVPYLVGKESKAEFLSTHLNFNYGDFYDTSGFFDTHIKQPTLLIGFHNLYYVDFPYIDNSIIQKGDTFYYVATQNTMLPQKFNKPLLVNYNKTTHVKVYFVGKTVWQ